jgi:hypothetical protein
MVMVPELVLECVAVWLCGGKISATQVTNLDDV